MSPLASPTAAFMAAPLIGFGVDSLLRPRLKPAGHLDQPVGERRFTVVDVGDDGEVADLALGACRHFRACWAWRGS